MYAHLLRVEESLSLYVCFYCPLVFFFISVECILNECYSTFIKCRSDIYHGDTAGDGNILTTKANKGGGVSPVASWVQTGVISPPPGRLRPSGPGPALPLGRGAWGVGPSTDSSSNTAHEHTKTHDIDDRWPFSRHSRVFRATAFWSTHCLNNVQQREY